MPPTGSTVSITSIKTKQQLEDGQIVKKQQTLNNTPSIKYASARIKLMRTESNQFSQNVIKDQSQPFQLTLVESALKIQITEQFSENTQTVAGRSSRSSTLCGQKQMRRLIELLINEFYRKRGQSYKLVPQDK